MTQIVTTGIVLARTNFGEADRILTIITPDHGKARVMARGVRKEKSKLAGGIELFSVSYITFIKGKSEIYTLISTRLQKHFGHIVKDLDRTMFGYNVLKFINKIVEDNSDEEYFHLLQKTLEGLDDLELSQQLIELWLNLQVLKLAGHRPNLTTDTSGNKLVEGQNYNFDLEKMSFWVNEQGRLNSKHIKLMRLAIEIESPIKLGLIAQTEKLVPSCLELSSLMLQQFIRE